MTKQTLRILIVVGGGSEASLVLEMLKETKAIESFNFGFVVDAGIETDQGVIPGEVSKVVTRMLINAPFRNLEVYKKGQLEALLDLLLNPLEKLANARLDVQFIRGVGSPRLWLPLRKRLEKLGFTICGVAATNAYQVGIRDDDFQRATASHGLTIHHGVHIGPRVRIGSGTLINTRAVIEHDCQIGKNCFIGPGAVLCGGVCLGDDVFVGAGAVIRPNIRVDDVCFIEMGSVVINHSRASAQRHWHLKMGWT